MRLSLTPILILLLALYGCSTDDGGTQQDDAQSSDTPSSSDASSGMTSSGMDASSSGADTTSSGADTTSSGADTGADTTSSGADTISSGADMTSSGMDTSAMDMDAGSGCVPACGENSQCIESACECIPGFVDEGSGECTPLDPGDPRNRTEAEICARWLADYPSTATQYYDEGAGLATCDPGEVTQEAHDDAMRRLNVYRWLLGLEPAGVSATNLAKAQAAALMMHANSSLSHSPPTSWTCYTAEGAEGAGSSNLSLGRAEPASTVDGYIRDNNTPSLGHRRWIFFPRLDDVGFGQYGSGGAMWVFGNDNSRPNPDYVAYPGPGFFPVEAIQGVWSISSGTNIEDATVTITALSDDHDVAVTTSALQRNFGLRYALSLSLGETPMVGETYRVEIQLADQTWMYETTLISCE